MNVDNMTRLRKDEVFPHPDSIEDLPLVRQARRGQTLECE